MSTRLVDVEMAAVAQQLGAGLAGDVLHHDEVLVVALVEAEVEHLDDVRVDQPRGGERLAAKARDERRVVGEVLGQQLERDVALESLVEGEMDGRHPADAEPALDPVSPCDRRVPFIVPLPTVAAVAAAAAVLPPPLPLPTAAARPPPPACGVVEVVPGVVVLVAGVVVVVVVVDVRRGGGAGSRRCVVVEVRRRGRARRGGRGAGRGARWSPGSRAGRARRPCSRPGAGCVRSVGLTVAGRFVDGVVKRSDGAARPTRTGPRRPQRRRHRAGCSGSSTDRRRAGRQPPPQATRKETANPSPPAKSARGAIAHPRPDFRGCFGSCRRSGRLRERSSHWP